MTNYAESGLAQVAYELSGTPGGADVLLIHAGVTDRRSWHHVVERLVANHRCCAFDQRGYGETRYEPESGWSTVADAVAVLDAADLHRVVVVGASIGGGAAIDLALSQPERVAGLVLIGAGVRGAPRPAEEADPNPHLRELIERAEADGDLQMLNRGEAWLWLDGAEAAEGRVGGEPRELFLEMNGSALAARDPGAETEPADAWPMLETIAVPTLVLAGELDLEWVRTTATGITERIPRARHVSLPGVAHLPHLEADPTTLEAITLFIDGLSR